ncbi:LOW QUALITY PROTEIN: hypothetical protein CRUP_031134 [Coryphaenoides rupestris]|nr:LOW QUALITY PROTEIN: hypothetical protein CRUP_031134 [Coryphaenoides rupestris]
MTAAVWILLILIEDGLTVAQKTKDAASPGARPTARPPSRRHCGGWVRNTECGVFSSPNYPQTYPPNTECTYILEALPRQRVELRFDAGFSVEAFAGFDRVEVREGPFISSPLIAHFCCSASPRPVLSGGAFSSDGELEGTGFQFELSGADGLIRSSQVEEENKVKVDQAIYLRFLENQMENSNESKKNFVAIYDGSNAIEHLKVTKTHGTVLGVSAGLVLLLLILSILVQVKQPRKKEVFDPPQYELFALRDKELSGELLSEELRSLQALRRSSSERTRCIYEHHCGSQASITSVKPGRGAPSLLELPPFGGVFQSDFPAF